MRMLVTMAVVFVMAALFFRSFLLYNNDVLFCVNCHSTIWMVIGACGESSLRYNVYIISY